MALKIKVKEIVLTKLYFRKILYNKNYRGLFVDKGSRSGIFSGDQTGQNVKSKYSVSLEKWPGGPWGRVHGPWWSGVRGPLWSMVYVPCSMIHGPGTWFVVHGPWWSLI